MTTSHRPSLLWSATLPCSRHRFGLLVTTAVILATSVLQAQTPAPATVAGTAAAATAPQPKPLIILRPDGVKAIALRARTVSVGANLLVETLDGSAQTLAASTYVNQLPWYTEAELESGRVDLNALAIRYRAFGGLYPDVQPTLYAEAQKFRNIAERLKTAGEQNAAATQKRAADFLAARFDPAKNATHEEVAGFVREGDELARLLPAQAAQFAQAAAPFRDALGKLDAGQTFYDGKWRPGAEAQALQKQRADTAIQQTFDKTLALPLEPLALTSGQLVQVLALPALVLLALLVAGLALLFGKRRSVGVLLLAVAIAGGGLGYALLTQNNAGTLTIASPEAPETQNSSARLVRLLYQASRKGSMPLPPEDRNVHLTDADLSSFLARHVQPRDGADASAGLRREGLALGVTTAGFTLVERAAAAGQTIFLRYDVKLDATGTTPAIKEYTVRAGNLPLPGPIKDWLWLRLAPSLGEYLKDRHFLDVYAVNGMARGAIDLAASEPLVATTKTRTSAPASTADQAEPVPMPAGTPEPAAFASDRSDVKDDDTAPLDLPPPVVGADGQAPSPDNTFYLYAIWDQIVGAGQQVQREQIDRLLQQFGAGNRFNRVGFAFIMPNNETGLISLARLAVEKHIVLGVIMGPQTHTDKGIIPKLEKDLRSVQWRLDGKSWRGFYTGANNAGDQEIGEDSRDHLVPSPSRYNKIVRDQLEGSHRKRCQILKRVMRAVPGAITCINGSIEEELAIGAASRKDDPDALLGDYSPFAVAEFRDWLCHTGEYDADKGKYPGDGAPESLVGKFIAVGGKPRSPFYSDPDPETSKGGGKSFNSTFGTKFKTWTLKYWDPKMFSGPITDDKFDCEPESGTGFTEGGFDAPRQRDASAWWRAWSWDYYDRNKQQPPGNPKTPAYGFRQAMVHHFNEDMFNIALKEGLPANLMFCHQVPGEVVGDARCRSGASPVWTGFLPFNGTVGITRFGPIDPNLMLQYTKTVPDSKGWGIFEWHPKPGASADDPKLYQAASHDLQVYYNNKCHHLFAGWWRSGPPPEKDTFPLVDSQFAKAIKDFMAARPDKPYPGTVVRR